MVKVTDHRHVVNKESQSGEGPSSPRVLAALMLDRVIRKKQSLSRVILDEAPLLKQTKQANLVIELCYGVLRYYPRLLKLSTLLFKKPLSKKDHDVLMVILLGFYQLLYLSMPAHAVLNETVKAVNGLKKSWATNFVNAILRTFLREQPQLLQQLDETDESYYAHPAWLIDMIKEAWPKHWEVILAANNERPPFTIRVNLQKISRADYAQCLLSQENFENRQVIESSLSSAGITLVPACSVNELPSFSQGFVSVQDAASQLAAVLLDLKPGFRVLDVCAAPGGKTCHMLECEPALTNIVAIDIEQSRANQIIENATRLNVADKIQVVVTDANDVEHWWDKQVFDRILLDAPCSAIGVIRRHPDIKILREKTDIAALANTQYQLLKNIWQTLKPGGLLIYSTCSILPMETTQVIQKFLQSQADAISGSFAADWGEKVDEGRFILPGTQNMDGFFYAKLRKAV